MFARQLAYRQSSGLDVGPGFFATCNNGIMPIALLKKMKHKILL
ncbi:hypothetical protein EC9_20650 [Rosistilla ulvae]|uniref:Uncharacterized protein n=1 Tax=Rosistilla ulvae TaxID=1930277 RepID=A0A517LZ38_9BACT|nr:hypothetical protein [Rosistilla ulvae]QDS87882.1 hypothetical protein EC9_20650 [Rosistilla ulvae]